MTNLATEKYALWLGEEPCYLGTLCRKATDVVNRAVLNASAKSIRGNNGVRTFLALSAAGLFLVLFCSITVWP
jgi:hypothetical protein